ncbi:hypothetical protein DFJ74DRAFT_708953 [Hyaloraphidium curvatum]|nr:hypothetical protein DFJ74DRAFT_708953 [Hyaloraphidium curvatum]
MLAAAVAAGRRNPGVASLVVAALAFLLLLSLPTECRPAAGLRGQAEPGAHIAAGFQNVYRNALWGPVDQEETGRGSGAGSSSAFTVAVRAYIEELVRRKRIRTIADVPCGSANWWPPLLAALRARNPCLAYSGFDVVDTVIEDNRKRYGPDPLTRFEVADVSTAPLPRADLVVTRDALQHLPLADAVATLQNIAESRPKFLLVGSYANMTDGNKVVAAGGYYNIELLRPPFSMPPPAETVQECCDEKGSFPTKQMYLYTGKQLAGIDWAAMKRRAAAFGPRG